MWTKTRNPLCDIFCLYTNNQSITWNPLEIIHSSVAKLINRNKIQNECHLWSFLIWQFFAIFLHFSSVADIDLHIGVGDHATIIPVVRTCPSPPSKTNRALQCKCTNEPKRFVISFCLLTIVNFVELWSMWTSFIQLENKAVYRGSLVCIFSLRM